MVVSWELALAMKKRTHKYGTSQYGPRRSAAGRWEMMTGWQDDIIDEEEDEDDLRSDGDIIGDVKMSGGRRGARHLAMPDAIPYEDQWETDLDAFEAGKVRLRIHESCRDLITQT